MPLIAWMPVVAMFLFPAPDDKKNPWTAKVADAVEKAERTGSVEAYETALDATCRADDWQAGLRLARAAREKFPDARQLRGVIARAFWRAGYVRDAEQMIAGVAIDSDDRAALGVRVVSDLARGRNESALRAARRLAARKDAGATDLSFVVAARMATGKYDGLGDLLRRTQRLVDPQNGYPEIYIGEELDGLADFFDHVGSEPLNQIASHGQARMTAMPLVNLPGCMVTINGHGPYRMVVDTGGSIMLSIDTEVAEDIGLESVARASVHGVSGKEEAGQAVVDELRIGGIVLKRVMTRIFGVRKATAFTADGIIGTGLFGQGRMTLDFENERLVVSRSSGRPAAGTEIEVRIVADAKLVATITVQGEPVAALFDSGADVLALAPSRLKRLFPDKSFRTIDAAVALGVGGEAGPKISIGPGVDLTIAGRTYTKTSGLGLDVLDNLLGPLLGIQTDVLVGMPIFRDTKSCTVDYPQCRMWLDWLNNESQ